MKFNMAKIDEDEIFPPDNSDFDDLPDDDEEEDDEYLSETDCFFCAGSGEGATPDLRCPYCNGRGTVKKRKI